MVRGKGTEQFEQPKPESLIGRREFLKYLLALIASGIGIITGHKLAKLVEAEEENLVELALLGEVIFSGKYEPDVSKEIEDIAGLREAIINETEKISGLSGTRLIIQTKDEVVQIEQGEAPDLFAPGSLVKIPVAYYAWEQGQKEGKVYLTPDEAEKILGESRSSRGLIKELMIAQGVEPGDDTQIDEMLRKILTETGVPPASQPGETLKVRMGDLFDFLDSHSFPGVIEKALRLGRENDLNNYGVSRVLRQATGGREMLFKIGLVEDEEGERIGSYVMKFGGVTVLGYAKGSNDKGVSEQMLRTAQLTGQFFTE